MEIENQLTQGSISKALIKLALPIMGTSFLQTAYTITDMFWIGKVGTKAAAAVGTGGFFTWLAMAFIILSKVGAEVGVAQSIGRNDIGEAKRYIRHTVQLNIFLGILYSIVLIVFKKSLIGFFNLGDAEVISMATTYLVIVSLGLVSYFINPVFTGILNGYGDSKTPFYINMIGLVTNIVLDPLFIFGFGPIPAMGVAGAALATVIAQVAVTFAFIIRIVVAKDELFKEIGFLQAPDMTHMRYIIRLSLPVALQNALFSIIAMFIAKIIANWGPTPIAVQKIGSQIEAISWMTAGGFSTALSTFVGQNYGANKWDRIYKGYFIAIGLASIVGLGATLLLVFGANPVFSVFLSEEEAVAQGINYLRILGFSQLFMCVEITTAGAFNGLGKTVPPSITGILFNALRIPAAIILSATVLDLDGVWWSISMTSVFKGIILTSWFILFLKKQMKHSQDKNIEIAL
ncbi:MATE family efflux transporter [Alkaliphilus oremlandii]|uniref:Probable multidrug resistance protein NorM n=1 Tax=Alkaliphilus oremlandii (strain OhILAs) TaxID=350688 RepID=A8MKS6_ALKOO|nr:MATE family efflux transporter [Alkaliphilus oremlandii]ABW17743.1 MATE efflux family protein [Alkaliphilus oremlandii OhILAs]